MPNRPAGPPRPGVRRPIVCLGDAMIDVLAQLPGPLVTGSDVSAPIRLTPGGSAANTACWLAVAGAPVSLIARVGDDAFGARTRAELATFGVRDRLSVDADRPTGTCIVLVAADGERTMVPDPGANAALTPADLDPRDFTADGHLHISGYTLLGGGRAAALAALERARAVGMTISVDAASAAPLAAAGAANFRAWLGTDLLLFANAAEAKVLAGRGSPESAARRLADTFGQAVVKVGAKGAFYCDGGDSVLFGPGESVPVVDTTGAGDAFAAMFLSALGVGYEPSQALAEANLMGAVACRTLGGRPPAALIHPAAS